MELTVGIITFERADAVETCLESIANQSKAPDEVIVVDDSEDEGTATVVRNFDDFEADVTLGYFQGDPETAQPGARNQIIEHATGDVICFVDDDTYCEEQWLETIADYFIDNPGVAAVGGPALNVDEDRQELADEYIRSEQNQNVIDEYGLETQESSRWIPPHPVETDFLLGANMAFDATKLRETGGFDTDYSFGPALFEETDVMAKLVNAGETIVYHPDALVYHYKTKSGGTRVEEKSGFYYAQGRSHALFIHKNFPENFHEALCGILLDEEGFEQYLPPLAKVLAENEDPEDQEAMIVSEITRGFVDGYNDIVNGTA